MRDAAAVDFEGGRVEIEFDAIINESRNSIIVSRGDLEDNLVIPRSIMGDFDSEGLSCTVPYWFAFKKGLI